MLKVALEELMDELVLLRHLYEVVSLLTESPNGREDRDLWICNSLVLLRVELCEKMCKSNSRAGSSNSRATVYNCSLIRIRGVEHVRKYLKHPHEGYDRIVFGYTVVRPSCIVQLAYLAIRDAQIAVRQPVLPQKQMRGELDWVA